HARPGADDRERYQTVYASSPGSVAAPTAGLHFTPAVLDRMRARGVEVHALTLHVGPATFRPITAARVEDHVLPPERVVIPDAVQWPPPPAPPPPAPPAGSSSRPMTTAQMLGGLQRFSGAA